MAQLKRLNDSLPSLREALRQAQQNYNTVVVTVTAAAAARQRALIIAGKTGLVTGAGVAGYAGGRVLGGSTLDLRGGKLRPWYEREEN